VSLPLQERAEQRSNDPIVRMTLEDLGRAFDAPLPALIPDRALEEGEQYRFHFNMTKCIGCRSCEVACNEQNGNPADIHWRRVGELEGGVYPDTMRHYLSMGCNHCLDAECARGCPVDAYTKDPVTGIVLHSADACIGCQYCVWNCPYSVPQFNAERGIVGKCDMCHGRLTDGLEPACVNACPEAAIEIEIVNKAAWLENFAQADSPGMPPAGHTISTTRITLPPQTSVSLERVDSGQIRLEHAHFSLVFMTTLIQAVTGALGIMLTFGPSQPLPLLALLGITAVALNISVFHLGRPAYAWRALKMWRRSWLSREVLLFGLFFGALATYTAGVCFLAMPPRWLLLAHAGRLLPIVAFPFMSSAVESIGWVALALGIGGTIASAFIYLVPARPSWNMAHTPLDFLLSALLVGSALPLALTYALSYLPIHYHSIAYPTWPTELAACLWLINHAVRLVRLRGSHLFEARAAYGLLSTPRLRVILIASFLLAVFTAAASPHIPMLALIAAFAGVLAARYLFFVSVVPLSMGLTFTRGGHA
jgi:formate dehydrogenase iron-sulfur subunit